MYFLSNKMMQKAELFNFSFCFELNWFKKEFEAWDGKVGSR